MIYVNTEVPVRFERKIIGREFRKSTMWRVGCEKGVTWWSRPEGVGCISDELWVLGILRDVSFSYVLPL